MTTDRVRGENRSNRGEQACGQRVLMQQNEAKGSGKAGSLPKLNLSLGFVRTQIAGCRMQHKGVQLGIGGALPKTHSTHGNS
jgi:hypothetical protein